MMMRECEEMDNEERGGAGRGAAGIPALMFGGAFNPPTAAHIELAHYAMAAAGAECVIFVPSKASYVLHHQGKNFSFTDEERLEMLRRIAQSRPWMRVSSYEIAAARQPRTYETMCHLREEGYAPRLLVGSDKLPELAHIWKYVDEMCREFGIVCLSRGGDDAERMIQEDPYLRQRSEYITAVDAPLQYREVSSTRVRELIGALRGEGDCSGDVLPGLREELHSLICEELEGLEEWL